MKSMFNETADKFTRDTDRDIEEGGYIRGDLFLEMARLRIPAGGYILDYGCGPGRLGLLLARSGFRVRGVDTASGMIAQARKLDGRGCEIKFDVIDGFEDVLQPAVYDAVVCSSVIEYVPDPDTLLRGFHRVLRDSGVLIISYANKTSLWRRYWMRVGLPSPMRRDYHQVWDWNAFRGLLSKNGFRALERPKFFDSPCDGRFGRLIYSIPYLGQVGIVAARRQQPAGAGNPG